MKSTTYRMNNGVIIRLLILLLLSTLFVLLFSTTTSPLFLSNPCWYIGDSGIFQEMGLVIVNGGAPYVDVFDHKGPLLFYIQALGLRINLYWGIFLVQILSLFLTLAVWHKILSFFNLKHYLSWIILLVGLLFLFGYYERGNLCEEWSLLFISLPLLFFVKSHFLETSIPSREWFFIGLCIGSILFIRANNIAPIIGFVIYYLVEDIIHKQPQRFTNIIVLVGGVMVIALFWLFLFYFKFGSEGVDWMIYGTFLFNFEYIQQGVNIGWWKAIIYYSPFVVLILLTILSIEKDNSRLSIPLIISLGLSFFAIGTNHFIHYLMILIPLMILTLAISSKKVWITCTFTCIMLSQVFYYGYSGLDVLAARLLKGAPPRKNMESFERFLSSIPEIEKRSIYCYHALPAYFFAEQKIVQQNQPVMDSHVDRSEKLRKHVSEYGLEAIQPTWVLMSKDIVANNNSETAVLIDYYCLKDSLWGENLETIYCYRRSSNN